MFEITYDYTQTVGGAKRTYTGNVVGRCNDEYVGYGPNARRAAVPTHDIKEVVFMLKSQLATDDVTLHLTPYQERE